MPVVSLPRNCRQSAFVVDESPEQLAAEWRGLLDDPVRRARLGAAARARAEAHFTPARLAGDVAGLYAAIGAR